MKAIAFTVACLTLASAAAAADVNFEGTFNTQFGNDRPNKITGGVSKTGDNIWAGELATNWKGDIKTFKGTITGDLKAGKVVGDFYLMTNGKPGRHFMFTATADNFTLKGPIVEIKGNKQSPSGDLLMEQAVPADGGPATKPAKP